MINNSRGVSFLMSPKRCRHSDWTHQATNHTNRQQNTQDTYSKFKGCVFMKDMEASMGALCPKVTNGTPKLISAYAQRKYKYGWTGAWLLFKKGSPRGECHWHPGWEGARLIWRVNRLRSGTKCQN